MTLGLTRIRHAKVPVADIRRSVAWYRSVLDLELAAEFAEQGVVRGVQLMDPAGGFGIALREREFCASKPDLAGFDVFAIEAESVAALHRLARCPGVDRTLDRQGGMMVRARRAVVHHPS